MSTSQATTGPAAEAQWRGSTVRGAGLVVILALVASCASAAAPGSRRSGDARPPPPPVGNSGAPGSSIAPPETLGEGFLLGCDDPPPTGRDQAIGPLLGISAPPRPPDGRTALVARRYRARPPDGAAALPPAVAAALDASHLVFDACFEDEIEERGERFVELTVTVDAAGRVVSVAAPQDRSLVQRCLMARLCQLEGAPSAGPTKAVIPLFLKEVVALNGVALADLPAVSIESARLRRLEDGALEDEELRAVTDAMISLMTQAAAVCKRAPLAWPAAYATFEVAFTAHSSIGPTLSFGEITRGSPAPDQALLQCVTESLTGRRMPGRWYAGRMKVRVTWDP